ncbi:MAG: hypothetical protein ABI318_14800 [Chthoniobacteraceae bacterium]
MKQSHQHSKTGGALIAVLIALLIVTALVGVVQTVTSNAGRMSKRSADRQQAIAYGDGILESLFDQWRNAMISVTATADRTGGLSTSALQGVLSLPAVTQLPPPPSVTVTSWSVTSATPLLVALTDTSARPTAENGTKSSLVTRLNYLAVVQLQYPGPFGAATVTVQRNFARGGRNLFSNYLFCTQPNIEINPGAPMYIMGSCYFGGNLFTATDYLHFTQDVTFTGTQTMNYRSNDPRYPGTAPTIQNNGFGDNWSLTNPPHLGQEQKLLDVPFTSLDPNFTDDPISNDKDSDGNPNNDGYHEMIEEAVAGFSDVMQLDPTITERLVGTADYRIYVNASNSVTIYKGTSTTPLAATSADYIAINGAITTNTALADSREGDYVRLVTLDVGKVATAYSTTKITDNTNSNDGLTFYIKDTSYGTSVSTKLGTTSTSVTSSRSRAVKLVNGASTPYGASTGAGFTVVSPNAVYIQGDYNTGTTASVKPATNTAATYTPPTVNPSPVVPGYNRGSCAVIADSINILSNAWSDAASSLAGTTPAIATTVNCALLGGNVPTSASSYSGGIENFVRFQENWSGVNFTIYGTMAALYDSEQAVGTWSSAIYSPPTRCWYYDSILGDTNPPGFHIGRTYERGHRLIR